MARPRAPSGSYPFLDLCAHPGIDARTGDQSQLRVIRKDSRVYKAAYRRHVLRTLLCLGRLLHLSLTRADRELTMVRAARTEDGLGAGHVVGDARLPLRLLMSSSVGRGAMDGAWWPQSRDLQIELADLVDHFPKEIGRITHAVYSTPDWLPAPRRIKVARGFIKAGSFPRDDTHLILLRTPGGEFLRVMVVPPGSTPDVARGMMKVASTPTNLDSARAILIRAEQRETAVATDQWNDDGGT